MAFLSFPMHACLVLLSRAIDASCRSLMEPEKQFWGDVFAKVVDPFGQHWQMAAHVEDVSPEEMGKRAKAFFQR